MQLVAQCGNRHRVGFLAVVGGAVLDHMQSKMTIEYSTDRDETGAGYDMQLGPAYKGT